MLRVTADGRPVVPTTLALLMSALLGNNLNRAIGFFEFYLANNTKGSEGFQAELLDSGGGFIIAADGNAGFLIAADEFITAEWFEGEKDGITQGHKFLPFGFGCLPIDSRVNFGQHRKVDALDVLRFVLYCCPSFLGGVNEDGGEQQRERVEDFVESGLAASARWAIRGVAIKAVFEQVHIDTAHIDAAEIIEKRKCHVKIKRFIFFINVPD